MLKLIIVSVVFGSIIALAALICGTILLIVKIRGKDGAPKGGDREEARIIQEVYQGLNKIEDRIEALEIILAENKNYQKKARKEQKGEKL